MLGRDAMRQGLHRKLNPLIEADFVSNRAERIKAGICTKVEHPIGITN